MVMPAGSTGLMAKAWKPLLRGLMAKSSVMPTTYAVLLVLYSRSLPSTSSVVAVSWISASCATLLLLSRVATMAKRTWL